MSPSGDLPETLQLTDAEFAEVQAAADAEGLSVEAFIAQAARQALARKFSKPRPPGAVIPLQRA